MTKDEWLDVAKILNDVYEFNGKAMFETPDKIMYWYSCLQDLDYMAVCGAVKRLAMTNPNRPTIADIRKECVALTDVSPKISEAEAWNMVRIALRDSSYHSEEHFEAFPDIVKKAVVSPARLKEWGQMPSDTVGSVVRAEFRRSFESAMNSTQQERQMGKIGTNIAEQIAQKLRNGLTMTREENQIGMKECKE